MRHRNLAQTRLLRRNARMRSWTARAIPSFAASKPGRE
ncbi:hypothetical protein LC55x_0826 [Lysobacter capsici]|nr:hypothetical protein LC55x_0826 [Lysobacter capsici]